MGLEIKWICIKIDEKKFRFLTFNDDTEITRYLHNRKKRRQERTKNAKKIPKEP